MDIDQQEALNSIQNSVYRTALKLRTVQHLCQLHLIDVSLIQRILPIHHCQTEKQTSLPLQQFLVLLKELFKRIRLEKPGQVEPKAPKLTLNLLSAAYDSQRDFAGGCFVALQLACLFRLYATSAGRNSSQGVHITRNGVRSLLTDLLQILTVVGESHNLTYVETAISRCFTGIFTAAIGEEIFLSWLQSEPALLLWLPTCHRLSATERVAHQVKCNICKTFPIIGLRYQCLKCLNVDICQVCFFTGQSSKPHKESHPVMEHCLPVSAKENAKLFFRTIRNNLFQRHCKRKEAQRRKALMMMGEGGFSSRASALPSSAALISSKQPAHPNAFLSVNRLDLPTSRNLGVKVFQAQQMEHHNRPQSQEDTSRQVLSSIKGELVKTQESVKALCRESRALCCFVALRYLRTQLNKRKGEVRLLHSAQEDGNRRLEAKIHDLIASQEYLVVELQKVKQGIKNITQCTEESLKERSFLNGPCCSLVKPSGTGHADDKSLDPTSACPEQKWLLGPQTGLFTRNSESLEIPLRKELFQSATPEANHHRNHGVRRVPQMPERSHPNQSQSISHCCPTAQQPFLSVKDMEEEEEEEEEELQQLMMKLKEALSFQAQPGQHSALEEEFLSSAEHVSKSFSDLIRQVSLPARKCPSAAGTAASLPQCSW
ncbi:dystrotelin [Eublepharis macularius]|uniref:Dystrotelin n=1 Tax=Eublepharis macularius TaxID=481883 RepID=A0AA97KQ68_EUBMA|nr:dystrotelin [Eublepharis macularius]